jgi:O-antigen ligase
MRAQAQRLIALDLSAVAWLLAAMLASAALGLLAAAEPIAAFDVAVIAVVAALIAWQPFMALLVLLFLRAGVATSPSSLLLDFLTLFGGAIALIACARSMGGRRVILPFLAFLAIALPTVPLLPSWDEGAKGEWLKLPVVQEDYVRNPSNELIEFLRLAVAFVAFAWAAWIVRTPRQLETVVAVILASAAYPIIVGLIEIATGQTRVRGGGFASVVGVFSHPNGFAAFLVIVLPLAVVALFETRSLAQRIAVGTLLAGGLVCLLYTYTRAGWVGFAIALLLLGLLRYRQLLLVGAVVIALAALALPTATQRAEERFDDLSAESERYATNSWRWRVDQWERMVPYGLEQPVFGQGFASYSRGTVEVFGTQDPNFSTLPQRPHGALGFGAHNDYVKTMVETGVVGLVLWVLTLVGVVVTAIRARRIPALAPWGTAVLAVALALSLVAFADNVQAAVIDMVYLFGLAGALAGALHYTSRRRSVPAVVVPQPEAPFAAVEVEPEATMEPEPVSEADTERAAAPEPAPEARRTPPTARARMGRWLRRRLL